MNTIVPTVLPASGHSDRKHAKYSASGAKRWMNCHGSIRLAEGLPAGVSSSYAMDGTEAHELIEFCFTNTIRDADTGYRLSNLKWTHRHDDYAERIDAIQDMLDHCYAIIDAYHGCEVFIEVEFPFPNTHGQLAGGTVDIAIYIPELYLLYIIDYKHGSGHAVEIYKNEQCQVYAITVATELRKRNLPVLEAVLTIVQPRSFHKDGPIRTWIVTDKELFDFAQRADNDIGECEKPGASLVLGEWCRWCPAEIICPLRETQIARDILPTFNSIKEIKAVGLPDPKSLPVERLAELLQAKDAIIEWLNTVQETATQIARDGVPIPNHKLVYAQAKSKWADMDPKVIAQNLEALSGINWQVFLRTIPITITDAKAFIKNAYKEGGLSVKDAAARTNEEVAFLTVKESSGNTTLVPLEDKRPAADVAERMVYLDPATIAIKRI